MQTVAAHEALHAVGDQCRQANPDPRSISASLSVIISFALRYPVGRFPIDDETATAASLLSVTREVVAECAPSQLSVVDAATRAIVPAKGETP